MKSRIQSGASINASPCASHIITDDCYRISRKKLIKISIFQNARHSMSKYSTKINFAHTLSGKPNCSGASKEMLQRDVKLQTAVVDAMPMNRATTKCMRILTIFNPIIGRKLDLYMIKALNMSI